MRARYLKNIQYIVIISDEPIRSEICESVSRFPNILLINGSPLNQESLLKANINYANKAVILGHDSKLEGDLDQINNEMLDLETIFIYKAIKKWNNDIQIMTELFNSSNIEFLLPKSQTNFDYRFSNLYAVRSIYFSNYRYSYLPVILKSTYCDLLQQILKYTSSPDNEVMIPNHDLCQSNLWQIPVPEECIGKTWEELFLHYLERDLICLGLYRLKGTTNNDLLYVYTDTEPKIINNKDKIFVFGVDIEQEKH